MAIQHTRQQFSTPAGGWQDQQATLIRDLAPLVQMTGEEPRVKRLKPDLLNLDVEAIHLINVCRFIRDQLGFPFLSCISGVDMLDHLETIYHIRSFARRQVLQLRVRLSMEHAQVDSIISVWPGANWLEREIYDLFGIHFIGHPDLRRILLDDDFAGFPMLKSFQQVPPMVKEPATTQIPPALAIEERFQTQHYEQVVAQKVGQGLEERLHPGTPTFGDTQEGSQREANENRSRPEGESAARLHDPSHGSDARDVNPF